MRGFLAWQPPAAGAKDDAEDSKCCDIWVAKSLASEWTWILRGYPLYMLFAFVECMTCAFAIKLVIAFSCHGYYVLTVFFAHCFLCDCAKREKDYQGQKGRDCLRCIMQNIKILNGLSGIIYVVGSLVMLIVLLSIPGKYESPAAYTHDRRLQADERRLQTMRPIVIIATNLAVHGQCDECMSIRECCTHWGKCPEEFETQSSDASSAWEQSEGGTNSGADFVTKCKEDKEHCWAGPKVELGQGPMDWVMLGAAASGGPCWQASRPKRNIGWAFYHVCMNIFLAMWQFRIALAAHRLHQVLNANRGQDFTWSKGEWNRLHPPAGSTPAAAAAPVAAVVSAVQVAPIGKPEGLSEDLENELSELKASVEEIQTLLERELDAKFENRIHSNKQ